MKFNKKISISCIILVIISVFYIFTLLNLENFDFGLKQDKYFNVKDILVKNSANQQEWFRLWHGSEIWHGSADQGYDVAIDNYGYCYLTGVTMLSGSNSDAFLIKYDSDGNKLWNQTWGGSAREKSWSIAIDHSSNSCYLVGETSSYGAGLKDGFIVKYDLDGNQLWNRTWGRNESDIGKGVSIDLNNNICVAGIIDSFGELSGDGFLIKFDPLGNQLWNRTWSGIAGDEATGIAIDSENNCYLSGSTRSFGAGSYDFFVAKYNSTGTQLWNKTWGGPSSDICQNIAIDNMNNCYLVGNYGYHEAVLLKLDSEGNPLWFQTWYGSGGAVGWDIAIDKDFNCYISGSARIYTYFEEYSAAILVKYSPSGEELGHRIVYGEGGYKGFGVAVDDNYNYYLSGSVSPCAGCIDDGAFVLKSNIIYPGRISGFEWLFALIISQIASLLIIELRNLKRNDKISMNNNSNK